MTEGLWAFLRQRGISEENISKLQEEKIDSSIFSETDDGYLARYIPAYGDRIAARRFCLDRKKSKNTDSKMSLLEKLQKKMKTATGGEPSQPKSISSKNALKSSRKIEIGWFHEGKQVKKRSGGGTRSLSVSKTANKDVLLDISKDLFFPNNKSKYGNWEDFVHDIYDFKETKIDSRSTVGQLYTIHKFGILRFYLNTRFATKFGNTDVKTEMAENINNNEDQSNHNESCVDLTEDAPSSLSVTDESDVENEAPDGKVLLKENKNKDQSNAHEQPITVDSGERNSSSQPSMDDSEIIIGGGGAPQPFDLDDTIPVLIVQTNNAMASSSPIQTEQFQPFLDVQLSEHDPMAPASPSPSSSDILGFDIITIIVEVHRINVLPELINRFKDEVLMNYRLKYKFVGEKGADADGVTRDIYGAFWNEFVNTASEGCDMRVPSLTPKWQEEEWRAIGRILAKGFLDQGYFPLRLAPAFTTALIFGEHAVSTDVLFKSLLSYLGKCDRDLITKALNEDLESDDKDELLDLLDRLGVTVLPTPDNLKALLLQVAHNIFIQKPKYALDNMSSVSELLLKSKIKTSKDIAALYAEKMPTCKKVLKLIKATPKTPAEQQALRFFQQYVREADEACLRNILRFVTGSDIIIVEKLQIFFTPLEGFERRPVAHTCGAVLELPSTYSSFPELRVELDNLLNSSYLAMDII